MSVKTLRVPRDGSKREPIPVGKWCKPVRVHVAARGPRFPSNLSAEGLPLFCRWLLHSAPDGKGHALNGVERVRADADRFEVWTDCGSVLLRGGGELQLNGGAGDWTVDVWVEEEVKREPEECWLSGYYATPRSVGEWPPSATHFRLLTGTATVSSVPLDAGVSYPIAIVGAVTDVIVQGFFQIGALLP